MFDLDQSVALSDPQQFARKRKRHGGNVMSAAEKAYLALVIAGFVVFVAMLFAQSMRSK